MCFVQHAQYERTLNRLKTDTRREEADRSWDSFYSPGVCAYSAFRFKVDITYISCIISIIFIFSNLIFFSWFSPWKGMKLSLFDILSIESTTCPRLKCPVDFILNIINKKTTTTVSWLRINGIRFHSWPNPLCSLLYCSLGEVYSYHDGRTSERSRCATCRQLED